MTITVKYRDLFAVLLALFLGWQAVRELRISMDIAKFHALDEAATFASDAVNAYDILRMDAKLQRAVLPLDELEDRYAGLSIEAQDLRFRATQLEHATAYPCSIRTLYRECLR